MKPMFSISIRCLGNPAVDSQGKQNPQWSVDIRSFDSYGILSPCGNCRLFRYLGDVCIFIQEYTGNDIPSNWPNMEGWNWQRDYIQTIGQRVE